jgi:hypothetical protein
MISIRNWSFLLVRLLSVYFIIHGFGQLFGLLSNINSTLPLRNLTDNDIQWGWIDAAFASYVVAYIVLGIVLWAAAGRLSGLLVRGREEPSDKAGAGIDFRQVEGFVLSAAGVLIVAWTLPQLAGVILDYAYLQQQDILITGYPLKEQQHKILELSLRIVIGLLLIWKANGIAGFIRLAREAGMKKSGETTNSRNSMGGSQ